MSWWQVYLGGGGIALILSIVMTALCRRWAPRLGFLDRPLSEEHKKHQRVVPVLGGVAMFAAWTLTLAFALGAALFGGDILGAGVRPYLPGISQAFPQLLAIWAGACGFVILGVIDDRRPLRALPKFFFQVLIAGIIALLSVRVTLFYNLPLITWGLTAFWLVFIVNAINFFDNMDGLAGGTAAFAAFFFALIAALRGQYFVANLGFVTCGTVCGFLVFNRPPASIFMGDGGSQFLGFMLGTLGALTTYYVPGESPTPAPVLIPLLVLGVPIFDLFAVVCIRIRHRKPFYQGDNRHISHRFEKMGLGRPLAVLLVLLLVFCGGASAFTLLWLPPIGTLMVLLQFAAILAAISLLHIFYERED